MSEFNYDDMLKIEAMDTAMSFVAEELGMVVLQSKESDSVFATWIYEQEIKGSIPTEYKRQQFTSTAKTRRAAVIQVLRGIKALQDIDVGIKLIPYREQLRLVKDQLGDMIDEDTE